MTRADHENTVGIQQTTVPPALRFGISGWAAAIPTIDTPAAWAEWSRSGARLPKSEAAIPAGNLPAALRRRLDRMGRLVMQVLFALGTKPDDVLVFASRFGEMGKSFELLRQIHTRQLPSPTTFALSVHNALAGQAAITLGNRMTHSAVAAGADTLVAGLMEAVTAAKKLTNLSSVLVYYDAPPPDGLDAAEDPPYAVALRLTWAPAGREAVTLEACDAAAEIPMAAGAAEAMLRFLADPAAPCAAWRGQHSDWRLARAA